MEQEQKPKKEFGKKVARFHDKYYKHLLIIPAIILLLSFIYMGIFYYNNQDFMHKDISLTGGTSITVHEKIDKNELESYLSDKLESLTVREISDLITREQIAVIIETTSDTETTKIVLEDYLGHALTNENSSFEFTGSALSEGFFKQLLFAVLLAFVFMALVVFIIFRNFVPSTAIILAAFTDIFMTLALFNFLGMQMSTAGIIAFLMLIGYSVDTDILLTNRVLKRHEGSLNRRIFSAFKTGTTMTLTSLLAIITALLIVSSFSPVLTKIFTVLVIGLSFDILNTLITNVSIIKWYVKRMISVSFVVIVVFTVSLVMNFSCITSSKSSMPSIFLLSTDVIICPFFNPCSNAVEFGSTLVTKTPFCKKTGGNPNMEIKDRIKIIISIQIFQVNLSFILTILYLFLQQGGYLLQDILNFY